MTEVFYRKWRPQRLDQVVGQEAIARTLRNEVTMDRVAQAYMFCGPRGTGKTSTARILAKAVNCLSPQDGEPDNACSMCVGINEGRAIDLVEIDAASNRGIDDIRSLREKVHFVPNEARYKVYIVDEVHMLTEPAFNALLKTLEEPPDHAIFVLATTEVHKVPLTIISRCQRFDFRRIPLDTASGRLEQLCRDEGIEAEEEALAMLARTAAGSLRDAENLLEQALISYGSPLRAEQVRGMLDLDTYQRALDLVAHLLARSAGDGLKLIDAVASDGGDLLQLHRGATEYLRGALLAKSGAGDTLDYPAETIARIGSMVETAPLERIVGALKTFSTADVRRDNGSRMPLELATVEVCRALDAPAAAAAAPAPPARQQRRPAAAAQVSPARQQGRPAAAAPAPQARRVYERPAPSSPPRAAPYAAAADADLPMPSEPAARLERQWPVVLRALSRHKGRRFNLGALLRACSRREVSNGTVSLEFSHPSHKERMEEEIEDVESGRALKEALSNAMDAPVETIVCVVDGQRNGPRQSAAQRSHLVRQAQQWGARVVDEAEVADEKGGQE